MMQKPQWFKLAHGRCVIIAEQRKRQGVQPPPRFLVLGAPKKGAAKARRTLCSGELRDDGWELSHGVISEALLREVLRAFHEFKTARASS